MLNDVGRFQVCTHRALCIVICVDRENRGRKSEKTKGSNRAESITRDNEREGRFLSFRDGSCEQRAIILR
jgi:hypothetical protein